MTIIIGDNTGGGGGGAVDSVSLDPNATEFIEQTSTTGTIAMRIADNYPVSLQGRDVGGIGDLTITTLNGRDVMQIAGHSFELILSGASAAVSQLPGATNVWVPVEFGPAENTSADPLSRLVDGKVLVNKAGTYVFKITYVPSRTVTPAGVDYVFFRLRKVSERFEGGLPIVTLEGDLRAKTIGVAADRETKEDWFILDVSTLPDDSLWTPIQNDYANNTASSIVASSGGTLYVSALSGAIQPFVHQSVNGGLNWTPNSTGLIQGVEELAIDRNDTIYAAMDTSLGVFRLPVGTATWVSDSIGLPVAPVQSIFVDECGGFIYAGVAGLGVYRRPFSGGAGRPWVAVNTGALIQTFYKIIRVGSLLFGVGDTEVFKSTDPAISGWTSIFTHTNTLRSITADGAGNIYVTGDVALGGGILPLFKSTDGGAVFNQVGIGGANPLPNVVPPTGGYALQSIPETNTVYVGTNTVGGSIASLSSTDGGVNWRGKVLISTNESLFVRDGNLYGTAQVSPGMGRISVNSVPLEVVVSQGLEGTGGGLTDGGLFQVASLGLGSPTIPCARLEAWRIRPLSEVTLGTS